MNISGHCDKIVHPDWLDPRIGAKKTGSETGQGLLVIEVGTGGPDAYRQGHLPGAIYLDTNAFERAPSWNIVPVPELEQVLLAHGVTSERAVVLYGNDRQAVARTAVALMYAGVSDVRWLSGGSEAWRAGGYAMEVEPHEPTPAAAFGLKIPAHPEYIIGIEQARALVADPGAVVACVRTWDEYTGKVSGYDYIQPKGRIAGSVWAGLTETPVYAEGQGSSPAHTQRICQAIASTWRERGVTPDKKVAFYCGTGWRASEAFLYAYLLGWPDICVYDGGWLEWSAHADHPNGNVLRRG